MIFGDDRKKLRQMYFDAWHKYQQNNELSALEKEIATVVKMHPEYHHQLSADPNTKIDKDYQQQLGESNPFLHMGLHLGLREQLATHRPQGIVELFQQLSNRLNDPHQVEHLFMEILGETIWQAQQQNTMPDEKKYLQHLRALVEKISG